MAATLSRTRRTYTMEEKAVVFQVLAMNEGNAKRTSRDTGIPLQTVKDWKHKWEREGHPPELEVPIQNTAKLFIEKAETVRDKALHLLDGKLEDANAQQLGTIVGILTDKINVSKGLATARNEQVVVNQGPSKEEMAKALTSALRTALSDAQERVDIIEDAEVVVEQPKGLPPAAE